MKFSYVLVRQIRGKVLGGGTGEEECNLDKELKGTVP